MHEHVRQTDRQTDKKTDRPRNGNIDTTIGEIAFQRDNHYYLL